MCLVPGTKPKDLLTKGNPMKSITRPAAASLLLLIALTITAVSQTKRQAPPKTPPKPAAAQTPAPTFDTLVPAETIRIITGLDVGYDEQFVHSYEEEDEPARQQMLDRWRRWVADGNVHPAPK